jgi:hypothetical protein
MGSFAVRRSFIPKRNTPKRWDQAMLECDRCGLMFERREMRRQRGLLVDKDCYDDLSNERGGNG